MAETTTHTVELQVRGNGSALKLEEGITTFGLTNVEVPAPAKVVWVPDPDNDANTIFWVTGVSGVDGHLPEGTVTLTLTYAGE
jgi:hypothetical protein